ncbi:rhodanese-like domain-containing protein [bacterium]|nr:rhodanese-like domain-containing protein [bacterium]
MSTVKQIALIVMLSCLAGFFRFLPMDDDFHLIKKQREPLKNLEQVAEATKNELTTIDRLPELAIIELEFAENLFENKTAVFLDARSLNEFQAEHITNAVHIDFEMIEDFERLIDSLDRNQLYVTYCGGSGCELSTDLGEYLFYEMEFQKILIFHAGLETWIYAGLPTE